MAWLDEATPPFPLEPGFVASLARLYPLDEIAISGVIKETRYRARPGCRPRGSRP